MTDEVKRGKGRPSRWGKNDSDKAAIARDVENYATITPYYQLKLVAMGLVQISITPKGQALIDANPAS